MGSDWISRLGTELALTIASPAVWQAFGQALLIAALLTTAGAWVARRSGLIGPETGPGAVLGVGLATGVCVATPAWAAFASSGRSAFTPVALTYALAIGMMLWRRRAVGSAERSEDGTVRRWLPVVAVAAASLAVATIVFGAMFAPRARDGVQPVEFMDEAFYSVLAWDLDASGTEWIYSPSGFSDLPGTDPQTWYHWGEVWLGAAVIRAFGTAVLDARHLVVLPILLLATMATTGALVQAFCRTRGRGAYLFGCLGALMLVPVPWLLTGYQLHWEVGLAFGVTFYGLAAVAMTLLLYIVTQLRDGRQYRPRVWLAAGTAALLLPSHVLVFLMASVGLGAGAMLMLISVRRGSGPGVIPPGAGRLVIVTCVVAGLTLAWGIATGHGLGGSQPSTGVAPFGDAWQHAMVAMLVGAGVLYSVPVTWWVLRTADPYRAAIAGGTTLLVVAAAAAWGLRFPDFNMFHAFFSAITLALTPVAVACAWFLWQRARATRHRALATILLAACVIQIGIGGVITLVRLERRGPGDYAPVPTSILEAMRALPRDAKVAYRCQPRLEVGIWDPWLASLYAHTGRRMVPMCFQADNLRKLLGAPDDPTVMSPFFAFAPQRSLYPTADAVPAPEAISAFLEVHGIGYLYQDAVHPDVLVPWAVEVFRDGDFRLLRVP